MISRKLQYIVLALVLAILVMGAYLVHLKRKAESIGTPPVAGALTAPVSGPAEQMVLYLANDEEYALRPIAVSSALPSDSGERGRLALHTVIARYLQKDSAHPLGAGSDVHDVYLLDPTSAVVNLNAAFAATHPQFGGEDRKLFLKAQLPELTRVRFLIEGKPRDTLAGHLDLSGWYDVALVSQVSSGLK